MYELFTNIFKREFVKNFSYLFTATFVVQIIRFALSPVFSRIFTPFEIGLFSTLVSIIGIATIASSLKYETAIVLSRDKKEAFSLVTISNLLVLTFSVLAFFGILLFNEQIITHFFNGEIEKKYIFYIPVAILILGFSHVSRQWFIYLKKFKLLSIINISTALTISAIKLVMGYFELALFALVFSHFIGTVLISLVALFDFCKNHKNVLYETTKGLIKTSLKKYINYPFYIAPQSFLNSFSQQLPLLFLTPVYGADVTGNYMFAFTLVGMPLKLVAQSFRSVFYKKLSDINNAGRDLFAPVLKSTLILLGIAVVPFTLLFIFTPYVFPIFLGEGWAESGYYARYISIWLFFGFCNVPAMVVLHVKMKQKHLFVYEMFLTSARFSMLYFGASIFMARDTILGYSLVGAFFNMLLVVCVLFLIRKRKVV